jgi:4-amino-4-deoxy-L-arabinose transferase-like glycosyltransferase
MGSPAQGSEEKVGRAGGGFRADLPWLGALILAGIALRGWQLTHAEVISRDSIDYIRIAWRLEHAPWGDVLRSASHHPGYPLVLLAVSLPVRHFCHGDLTVLMQLSAQLTSALAGVLLIIPMFYLGRELFGRSVGFWATLFFQCLPAGGRQMADGLSEPVFLLASAAALLFACRALQSGYARGFALAGLYSGLAYLIRPEGALIAPLTGVLFVGMQVAPRWRRPWRQFLFSAASLTVGFAAVGGPFAWTIGGLTTKPTANDLLKPAGVVAPTVGQALRTTGPILAVWWSDNQSPPSQRTWWGLVALLEVLSRAFFYAYWLPTLLGVWWFRDRFRLVPGTWVLLMLCLTLAVLLYRVAQLKGYLSDRHTLLIVLCGSYFGVAALARIGETLAGLVARRLPALAARGWASRRLWSTAVLALAMLGPLPRTLQPLHADRIVFRTAGCWLAAHTPPGDYVLDPYRWANYYAGRVFTEGRTELPASHPPIYYLVVEQSPDKTTRLPEHHAAELLAKQYGKLKEILREPRGNTWTEVAVYEMPGHWPSGQEIAQ